MGIVFYFDDFCDLRPGLKSRQFVNFSNEYSPLTNIAGGRTEVRFIIERSVFVLSVSCLKIVFMSAVTA